MSNFSAANAVTTTSADDFVPEVWSLETLAAYQKNLVMAALVTVLNHKGKKGDTIHIPVPARADPTEKTVATMVVPSTFSSTTTDVLLNQHWYYSRLLEDLTEIQGLASLRQFFTKDAGYSLAKKVDSTLHALAATWGGGTAYTKAVIGGDGSTEYLTASAGNGTALTDAGLRRVIQTLDDADVPGRDRFLIVPPVEKRRLLGEARFTEQAFVGEGGSSNSIRNGLVGDLYGVDIYVSSNGPVITAADTTTTYRACLLFQREALVLAEQLAPRVQQQYKLEALGSLMVSDLIFGTKTVRGGAAGDIGAGCKAIIVPAT
jgi:N4-gp56 family major capsid protein